MAVERHGDEQVVVKTFLLVGLQHPDGSEVAIAELIKETVEVAVRLMGAVHAGRECKGYEGDVSHGVTEEEVVDGHPQEVEGFLDVPGDRSRSERDQVIARGNQGRLR